MIKLAQARLPSLAAFQRTEIAFARQVLESVRLSCGEAHFYPRCPEFGACCFVTDFDCEAAEVADSLRNIEATYAQKGGRCDRICAALGAAADVLDPGLRAAGFVRRDRRAFAQICGAVSRDSKVHVANADFRVLAARAMPRAYRKLLELRVEGLPEVTRGCAAAVAIDRLDDAQFEPWVVLCGDEPVGTAALHTVGDVGAVHDLFVVSDGRRQGVATMLIQRIAQTAQRWHLEALYAGFCTDDAISEEYFRKSGFDQIGFVASWVRA